MDRVYVDGQRVESVADAPSLQPGINALGVTYDFAHDATRAPLMTAVQAWPGKGGAGGSGAGRTVNRMLHIDQSAGDLLNKLEAVRILCQETGCAQRYLAHDALNAICQVSARIDDAHGSTEHRARFAAYLDRVQAEDLPMGIPMTDAKGDRSRRPHEQANPETYVHVVERSASGIVISGTKAIVTGAPYMHEFLVMPCRSMEREDADFAVCCAVPVDAPGIVIIARPAGRPGEKTQGRVEHGAPLFSRRYGKSSVGLVLDRVFVARERAASYRARRNCTRSCFSCCASLVPSTRLKNSTVSSSVSRRPSCR
jgi:4-hydroxybutyryl-CoA dehydratase/vinylacetyl-CoA-Delta-isomerase